MGTGRVGWAVAIVATVSACLGGACTSDDGDVAFSQARFGVTCTDAELAELLADRATQDEEARAEGSVVEVADDSSRLQGTNVGWVVLERWPGVARDNRLADRDYLHSSTHTVVELTAADVVRLGPQQEASIDLLAVDDAAAAAFSSESGPLAEGDRLLVAFSTSTERHRWVGVGRVTQVFLVDAERDVSVVASGPGDDSCSIRYGLEQLASAYAAETDTVERMWDELVVAIADGDAVVRWLQRSVEERLAVEAAAVDAAWWAVDPAERTVSKEDGRVPQDLRHSLVVDSLHWAPQESWQGVAADVCSRTVLGWGEYCVPLGQNAAGLWVPHRPGDSAELVLAHRFRPDGVPQAVAVIADLPAEVLDDDGLVWLEPTAEALTATTLDELVAAVEAHGAILRPATG